MICKKVTSKYNVNNVYLNMLIILTYYHVPALCSSKQSSIDIQLQNISESKIESKINKNFIHLIHFKTWSLNKYLFKEETILILKKYPNVYL